MADNKVVWSEGMFLRPQHFQQHDRYLEGLVEARCAPLRPYAWGFEELKLDGDRLRLGKIAVERCRGVLPDGTPFNLPGGQPPPPPLEVPDGTTDTLVTLALPERRGGAVEADRDRPRQSLARCVPAAIEVRDSCADGKGDADVEIGTLNLQLLAAGEPLDAYTVLGVAHIEKRQPDGQLVLDDHYLPPCLDCRAVPRLHGFVAELAGLLKTAGEELAGRVGGARRGGVPEIEHFLLLQTVNRYEPLLHHLVEVRGLHPEAVYRLALQLAGEAATFSRPDRRPVSLPAYRHDALRETFEPLMFELRQLGPPEYQALSIPLKEYQGYNLYEAVVHERELYQTAEFVVAAAAEVPAETLLTRFPQQTKVGTKENIRELVTRALPGVGLRALPAAPRQIPYHAGFSYFALERHGPRWDELAASSAIALHVSGEFPGLRLELWAIRGAA